MIPAWPDACLLTQIPPFEEIRYPTSLGQRLDPDTERSEKAEDGREHPLPTVYGFF